MHETMDSVANAEIGSTPVDTFFTHNFCKDGWVSFQVKEDGR